MTFMFFTMFNPILLDHIKSITFLPNNDTNLITPGVPDNVLPWQISKFKDSIYDFSLLLTTPYYMIILETLS